MADQRFITADERVWEALPGVKTPVLVMNGDLDALVPHANARRIAARIPGARLHTFEGCACRCWCCPWLWLCLSGRTGCTQLAGGCTRCLGLARSLHLAAKHSLIMIMYPTPPILLQVGPRLQEPRSLCRGGQRLPAGRLIGRGEELPTGLTSKQRAGPKQSSLCAAQYAVQ